MRDKKTKIDDYRSIINPNHLLREESGRENIKGEN